MSEIDRVKVKIRNLLNKTIDNGCTEHEAMMAAEKAGELLAHWGLSVDECVIEDEPLVLIEINNTSTTRNRLDSLFVALAKFCECRLWYSKGGKAWNPETRKYVRQNSKYCAYGFKQDVEVLEYLYNVIKIAYDNELEKFKKSDHFQMNRGHGTSKSMTHSFTIGFCNRVSNKLTELYNSRQEKMEEAASEKYGALVVLKGQLINQGLEKMKIKLTKSYSYRSGARDYESYYKGHEAGGRVSLKSGITGGSSNKLIGA